EEFRRAFAVATCHDFFNYMVVLVLLPLELMTGFLQKSAFALASAFSGVSGADYDSPIKGAIKAGGKPVTAAIEAVFGDGRLGAVMLIVASGAIIFVALLSIVSVMRSAMQSRVEGMVSRALENNAIIAIAIGIVATVMVQSSSITTSLLVPLAGAGVLTLTQAFPVTLGANIGTTVTALLAALAATDDNAHAGLTIALVHLLFNLSGTLLVYPFPKIRRIPLNWARKLADVAVESRKWALLYVVLLFYMVPALFAVLNRIFG
ncbi:MAG: Na/Pi symporter, partial [Gemmatimonadota bacterium]|nr:Na/Pi symporter [Gemmatimonadota bacterium]